MNQMEIFKNPEFGSIRVVEENGKYLFCGADAATELWDTARFPNEAVIQATVRVCRETRRTSPTEPGPQNQYDSLSPKAICTA